MTNALLAAGLIGRDRFRGSLMSMGAYLYAGGPTYTNWRK